MTDNILYNWNFSPIKEIKTINVNVDSESDFKWKYNYHILWNIGPYPNIRYENFFLKFLKVATKYRLSSIIFLK